MVLITEELVRKKSEHNEGLISTLEELSLHQEDIERIEHIHKWCKDLKILLLQSNLISRLENLHKLKRLEYLNVAVNNIERIENLEGLESLKKLDLTLNFIGHLTSIESLRGNYNLRDLILVGNPCRDFTHYRDFVIATLPQLESLDCEYITPSDRLLAQHKLAEHRDAILQRQLNYAIERDEQRVRVTEQQFALAEKCNAIEDEEERTRAFWNAKSEHCPEIRNEIARQHKLGREKHEPKKPEPVKKTLHLFAPNGRPFNLNQPKLVFKFQDNDAYYMLRLNVYKYLDTSRIEVDVHPKYVRVTVKNKIFQMCFDEEVRPDDCSVQRNQLTGHLLLTLVKENPNIPLSHKSKPPKTQSKAAESNNEQQKAELSDTVNISDICIPSDLPDLLDLEELV